MSAQSLRVLRRGMAGVAASALLLPLALAGGAAAQERVKLKVLNGSDKVVFSPDSALLAVPSSRGEILLWDVVAEKTRHILKGHTNLVTQLAFTADAQTLIAVHTQLGKGHASAVKHWDVASGKEKDGYVLLGGGANRALTPDGRFLVTVSGYPNNTAKVWDLTTKKVVATLQVEARNCGAAALTRDGKIVALGGGDGEVKLWDLPVGKPRGSFKMPADRMGEMAFSPNSSLLVARGGSATDPHHFWDVAANKLVAPPKLLYGIGGSFSPDGKVFVATAATGPDFLKQRKEEVGWVEMWSLPRLVSLGKLTVKTDAVFRFVTFSPDGRIVAAFSGGTLCLWDVPPLKP